MRYLFRGLIRDTGNPVEGHVEAATEDAAYADLSSNGVVTESLVPDPSPLNLNKQLPQAPEFADALESAFDSSSAQIEFDALTQRYSGKKVWVIDRDKIRRRVAQVVDVALTLSAQHGESPADARQRVANAIQGVFADNRNLASERNAESVMGMRLNSESMSGFRFTSETGVHINKPGEPNAPPSMPAPTMLGSSAPGHPGLEQQIARLANVIRQAEAALTAISTAARNIGEGGGGALRRRSLAGSGRGQEQNAVLLEIFKSNLQLVRAMQDGTAAPDSPPAPSAESVPAAEEIPAH